MKKKSLKQNRIFDITVMSVCTASIIISAWLTIPFFIGITLQTLAIFLVCLIFKFKISFFSILSYILIGALGLPVFSGFNSGIAAIVGSTGGFILSFMLFPVIFMLFGNHYRKSHMLRIISMISCLLICYLSGTLWYCLIFCSGGLNNIWGAMTVCVFPFIIPDIIKIFLADLIYSRLHKFNFGR